MPPSVLQINVSPGGLPKHPISYGEVGRLGIKGDHQAHPEIHGGPRQALLIITSEGIDELKADGFPVYAGALGENITTQGLDRRKMRPGQRYRIGGVTVELTKMRQPCKALNPYGEGRIQSAVFDSEIREGDASSPRWGLGGFYAAVIQAGEVHPGDPITLLEEAV